MAFHSFRFLLVFLPLAVAMYRWLVLWRGPGHAQAFLLLTSVVFYLASGWRNAMLLAFSILANFLFARRLAAGPEGSGHWLRAGIAFNVALLCWFKYAGAAGLPMWGFPLGVSFFTVQQIMYLVDVQQRLCGVAPWWQHVLAVTYFPYVSAGPITRVRDMVKQFASPLAASGDDLAVGLLRFACGLFKKTVLADSLAIVVDAGYGQAVSLGLMEAWLSAALYLLQLYLDFSGYSDMAVGLARMLGHTIPENFNHPMMATSITEFWQRWHISLTNFINSYLYTPLMRGMGKVTPRKAMGATVAVMVIAGAWHGSGLQFVLFGLLHGLALAAHLAWRTAKRKMPNAAGRLLTFTFVVFAFLFFRSPDLVTLGHMLTASANGHAVAPWSLDVLGPALKSNWRLTLVICLLAPWLCFTGPVVAHWAKDRRWSPALAAGVAFLLLTSLLFMNSIPDKGFIYAGF